MQIGSYILLAQTSKDAVWWAPVIIVIGVVGMGVLLTLSIRGKVARRHAATPSARERIEQVKARGNAATVAGRESAAEIEAMDRAGHLAAILDNKAARLEVLIEQADERLAELNQQIGDSPQRMDDAQLLMELQRARQQPPAPLISNVIPRTQPHPLPVTAQRSAPIFGALSSRT